MNKPPYRVPSMKSIARRKKNGYRILSTFSGCGGSCLGFRMAGFETLWASEFIPAARETYEANHPGVIVDSSDIREVDPDAVMKLLGLVPGEIDVLEGSPPCSSFSMSGSRDKGWDEVKDYSETKQRTDDLFFEFARLLKAFQPRVFVAENVPGLVRGVAKGYFIEIMRTLRGCGYDVQSRLLDAQWLGVPQSRTRLIIMGVREDLQTSPAFPEPLSYNYSIRDAIEDLVDGKIGAVTDRNQHDGKLRSPDEPSPTIMTHWRGRSERSLLIDKETSLEGYAISSAWDRLSPGQTSEQYFNLVRPHPDKPCPTVTQLGGQNPGTASVTHPVEKRKFTIAELRRICSFPDDFELTGGYSQQWERCGRAVPPVMMSHVAKSVEGVLREADGTTRSAPVRTRSKVSDGIHKALLAYLSEIPEQRVAVLLSAGLDSNAILLALQEIGKEPVAYSFRLDGVYSTDFKHAQRNAETFEVPFHEVVLPTDSATLLKDIRFLISHGARKKTAIECSWPVYYALQAIEETDVADGIGCDPYFSLSKKAMMHYRDTPETMEQYREDYFTAANPGQRVTMAPVAEMLGVRRWSPYFDPALRPVFAGTTWDELNKPHQKQALRDVYPEEFARIKIHLHTNFQFGDSGIAKHFTKVLMADPELNPDGQWKSVIGIYNQLAKEACDEHDSSTT
jgi:DNA (cytosine-5)-methyltransferase 1